MIYHLVFSVPSLRSTLAPRVAWSLSKSCRLHHCIRETTLQKVHRREKSRRHRRGLVGNSECGGWERETQQGGDSIAQNNCKKIPSKVLISTNICINCPIAVKGWNYLFCQRFSVCFVLKIAPQRREGEKKEGVQISKQTTQNLRHKK